MSQVPMPVVGDDAPSTRATAARRDGRLRQRYGLLLVVLVTTFMVMGVLTTGAWQEAVITALAAATLVLALRAGEVDGRLIAAATAGAAVAVLVVTIQAAAGGTDTMVARLAVALLVLLAPPAVVVGVVRSLREHQGVTVQAVLGVLCIYILIGMFYAALYAVLDRVGGTPFFDGGAVATTSNCLYFSFTTLTTVGYGDLTAATNV